MSVSVRVITAVTLGNLLPNLARRPEPALRRSVYCAASCVVVHCQHTGFSREVMRGGVWLADIWIPIIVAIIAGAFGLVTLFFQKRLERAYKERDDAFQLNRKVREERAAPLLMVVKEAMNSARQACELETWTRFAAKDGLISRYLDVAKDNWLVKVQNVSNLGFQAMASLDVLTAAELAQRLEAFFNSSLALAEKREAVLDGQGGFAHTEEFQGSFIKFMQSGEELIDNVAATVYRSSHGSTDGEQLAQSSLSWLKVGMQTINVGLRLEVGWFAVWIYTANFKQHVDGFEACLKALAEDLQTNDKVLEVNNRLIRSTDNDSAMAWVTVKCASDRLRDDFINNDLGGIRIKHKTLWTDPYRGPKEYTV